jgi:hypothetical protein
MAISEQPLCDGLRYRGLSHPSEPMEPEDGRLVEILRPPLDFIQQILACPLQATPPVPVLVPSSVSSTAGVQHQQFSYQAGDLWAWAKAKKKLF